MPRAGWIRSRHDPGELMPETNELYGLPDFVIDAKRIATLPLMRPVRRRVLNILHDAGLLSPAGA